MPGDVALVSFGFRVGFISNEELAGLTDDKCVKLSLSADVLLYICFIERTSLVLSSSLQSGIVTFELSYQLTDA